MQLDIIQSPATQDRIKITFTKDKLIEQVKKCYFICTAIELVVEEKTGMMVVLDSSEVIHAIRQLVPNRFRKIDIDKLGVDCSLGEVLLMKYQSRQCGPLVMSQIINTRINLIKAIPSNEITFDLAIY